MTNVNDNRKHAPLLAGSITIPSGKDGLGSKAYILQLCTAYYLCWCAIGTADSQEEYDPMEQLRVLLFGELRSAISGEELEDLLTLCED